MILRFAATKAKYQVLPYLFAWQDQCAKHPIPKGKHFSVVTIPVLGSCAVMDLVVGGANEDMIEKGAKREPDVRVMQIGAKDPK